MTVDSQVKVLENVVDRIDTSIEKLTEVSNSIGKLLAAHSERLNTLEKVRDRQEDDIRDIYARIGTISKEICEKLDQVETTLESQIKDHSTNSERMHKELKNDLDGKLKNLDARINLLESWRWLILGGASVLGFLANKALDIFK
jgi:flagellar biosynthesis chaperone FliJ